MKILRLFRCSAVIIAVLGQGCSSFGVGELSGTGMNRDEFASYVETVFRFQNHMTSEVMMLRATEEDSDLSELSASEQRMQELCAPLNEYVSRDIDGLDAGIALRRRVVKTAIDCDRAAHQVELLLNPGKPIKK